MNDKDHKQPTNNLTPDELAMVMIMRSLKPFEVLEFKLNESGDLIYTYTKKDRYIVLTHK